MTREQIIKEVLARMDEISPLDAINVLPNPVVDKLLDGCIRNLLLSCPVHLCPGTDFSSASTTSITVPDVNVTQVVLPTGFLRLIRFRLSSWARPTGEVVQEGSNKYKKQFHKYTTSGTYRPVVSVVTGTLGLSLEYYYAKTTNPSIQEAVCVVETDPEDIPTSLLTALFWLTASEAFQVFEMIEPMKACIAKVDEQYKLLSNGI